VHAEENEGRLVEDALVLALLEGDEDFLGRLEKFLGRSWVVS